MFDKDLFKLIKGNYHLVVLVILLMILGMIFNISITACLVAITYFVNQVINFEFDNYLVFLYISIALVVCVAFRYLISRVVGSLKDKLGRDVKKNLREKTYEKILSLGVKSNDDMSIAGLTQISIEGIEQLDLYFSTYIPQFFYSLIAPLLLFVLTIFFDWKVSLVLLACVPLIPMSIVMVSKYAKKIFAKYWGKYITLGDGFLDVVQGLKELKVYQADERYQDKMNDNAEEFRRVTMKVLVMQLASVTIMDLVAFLGSGIGIVLTIVDVRNGSFSSFFNYNEATLPVFCGLFIILIAVEFFLPLRTLGSAFHVAMNGVSAGKKIEQLLAEDDPKWGEKDFDKFEIEFNGISYTYPDKTDPTINDVSMSFKKGITSIVGESGCGKSTIANIILAAKRPQVGSVKFGGYKLEEISRENFYKHVGIVNQQSYLFNESIRANFQLAKSDITDEEILSAIHKVNLDAFVHKYGLDLTINEDSANLSGGEKQRLILAIALCANKDIYIFDEATSNIDINSEEIIMKNIHEISSEKTVVLISHRLENVVPSNFIYFMENGKIVESGKHGTLLEKNGGYAGLFAKQKALEEGYLHG